MSVKTISVPVGARIPENIEAALCYPGLLLTGLLFLMLRKDSPFIRFHALQSIGVSSVFIALGFIPYINLFTWVYGIILTICLMAMAYRWQMFNVPGIGKSARKYIR